MRNSLFKNFLIFLLVFIIIASIFSLYNSSTGNKPEVIGINRLIELINNQEVKKIEVSETKLKIQLNDDSEKISYKEASESLSTLLNNFEVAPDKLAKINIEIKQGSSSSIWLGTILPFLIPFLLIAGFIWFMMRQVQGANNRALTFSQTSAKMINKDNKNRTTFNDVAGAKEAKEELV